MTMSFCLSVVINIAVHQTDHAEFECINSVSMNVVCGKIDEGDGSYKPIWLVENKIEILPNKIYGTKHNF